MSRSKPVEKIKSAVDSAFRVFPRSKGSSFYREFVAPRFHVGLERPLPYETLGQTMEIRGWAVSLDSSPVHAQIVLNDRLSIPVSIDEHRIDVARAYDLDVKKAQVGFCHQVSWDEIGDDLTRAELRLEFYHQEQSLILGPIPVFRAGPGAEPRFAFRLERPASNEVVSGDIEVSGWAVSLDGQAITGRIRVNQQEILPLAFDQDRPDVSRVYDLAQSSQPSGFQHRMSWQELGSDCTQVNLSVEIVHGRDLIGLGPFSITREGAPILRHQRGSYKEVWNGAASDRESAMATVAGICDDQAFDDSGRSTANTIKEALDITPDDVVLEIGCGVGRVGRALAPSCKKWIGVDISEGMIEHARENLSSLSNVELISLSSCSLSEIADESIDKLYCSTVFMHLDEWDRYRYVQEAFRVLTPDGKCYFDNVNLGGEIGWVVFEEIMAVDPAQRSAAVSKPSTGEELTTYLKMAGFVSPLVRSEPLYITVIGSKPL